MTDFKATPEQWKKVEGWASVLSPMSADSACILELRARVEALEAQARSREVADPAPVAGGLVERVKLAIDSALYDEDDHQWNEARAAILEVAAWLDTRGFHGCSLWLRKEQEAGR